MSKSNPGRGVTVWTTCRTKSICQWTSTINSTGLRTLQDNMCLTVLKMFYQWIYMLWPDLSCLPCVSRSSRLRLAAKPSARPAWRCAGVELRLFGSGVVEENAFQVMCHLVQCLPLTLYDVLVECIQYKTHSTVMCRREPQEVILACGHQTIQVLPQSVRVWVNRLNLCTYFIPVCSFITPSFIIYISVQCWLNSTIILCNNPTVQYSGAHLYCT